MRNKEKGKQKIFYVYVYLDTTKPGRYIYEELGISFLYEPFYVGKGHDNRYRDHLSMFEGNIEKNNIIKRIIKDTGKEPGIIKIKEGMNEHDALEEEKIIIKIIKRNIDGGPLTNKSIGGRGGSSGVIKSEETIKNISKKYIFVNPKNEKITIYNLKEFCKNNNLVWDSMYRVYSEKTKSHRGYRKYVDNTSLLPYKRTYITTAKEYNFINPVGIKITIFNLTQFCKENGLGFSSMLELNKGLIPYHKKWTRYIEGNAAKPFDMSLMLTTYVFISPDGKKIFTTKLKDFCMENDLWYGCMYKVYCGEQSHHRGWIKYSETPIKLKKYIFVNPDGEKIITNSISKLSKENNLSHSNMYSVNSGKLHQHKGWRKFVE